MQINPRFKTFITVGLAVCIIACNSSDKKDKGSDKSKDTATAEATPPPTPVDTTPQVEVKAISQKCFTNDGLKYSVVISINMGDKDATGTVTSEELGSGEKKTTPFEATVTGDALTVKFKGTAPVVGDASEWTSKPWKISNKAGKEKLHIVFNAKSYETNKWVDTDYEFDAVGCK